MGQFGASSKTARKAACTVGSRSPSCLKSLFFAWEGRLLVSLRGQPQAGRGNLGMRKSFVCKRLLRSARNDKRRLPFSWHKKNVLLWTLLRQFVERDPTRRCYEAIEAFVRAC